MRVLGIDPGTTVVGWGVVDERANRMQHVASGVLRPKGELPARLAHIHGRIAEIIAEFLPSCISLEKAFVGENIQSAFRLGEARGAILLAAGQRQVSVAEYSPAQIKLAVAGAGRASKHQMQLMVRSLLGIAHAMVADEADALAIALCHLHTQRFVDLIGVALPTRRRGGARQAWERLATKS